MFLYTPSFTYLSPWTRCERIGEKFHMRGLRTPNDKSKSYRCLWSTIGDFYCLYKLPFVPLFVLELWPYTSLFLPYVRKISWKGDPLKKPWSPTTCPTCPTCYIKVRPTIECFSHICRIVALFTALRVLKAVCSSLDAMYIEMTDDSNSLWKLVTLYGSYMYDGLCKGHILVVN